MPRRALGSTGVQVSAIGIGGFHLGIPKDAGEATRIVHMALDHGVTFFDNCWDYHDGESENRLGTALQGHREQAFLMTKLDGQTKASAMKQLEDSLRRLKTDTIDLLQMHEVIRAGDPSRHFAAGGSAEAFLQAKQQGKIRFIGFTGHKDPHIHLAMLDEAKRNGFRFDTVQLPLNVLDHHFNSFEALVLPRLKEEQIGVLGMKPIAAGKALKSGVTAQECLRYALGVGSDVTITGCDSVGVLEQALKVVLAYEPLSDGERAALLAKTAPKSDKGELEAYKMTHEHDTTIQHPEFLG